MLRKWYDRQLCIFTVLIKFHQKTDIFMFVFITLKQWFPTTAMGTKIQG